MDIGGPMDIGSPKDIDGPTSAGPMALGGRMSVGALVAGPPSGGRDETVPNGMEPGKGVEPGKVGAMPTLAGGKVAATFMEDMASC
jgi:hypothetical protein